MLLKVLFLAEIVCLGSLVSGKFTSPSNTYPQLYRDYAFTELSDKGKEMFFAPAIHPSCKEKMGYCMQRARCIEKKMLYISRVCYKRDLVCCYDDTITDPVIGILRSNNNNCTDETGNCTTIDN